MENIIELIKNLNEYVLAANEPMSFGEYFATIICPTISTIAIIVGGGFALYKYRASQNYDINLKILNEVYLPLYSYLVKQETFRFITVPECTWEEAPILEIKNTRVTHKFQNGGLSTDTNTTAVCGCTRDSLLEVCETTNLGLASIELVTLLNSYKILINITSGNVNGKEKAKAAILQEKVEIALRKEILKGYDYYHKKLKLHDSNSDIYRITKEQIEFLPDISDKEIAETIAELESIK